MPKVLAYKCPHTGKLFEEKREYDNHLRRLARVRRKDHEEMNRREILKNRWVEFRNSVNDIKQLPKQIIDNQDLFWETAAISSWHSDFDICRREKIWPKLVEFTEFSLAFSESVSNSHRCPVNGVTNWGGYVKDAPRGYPGWSGRINWIVEWPHKYSGCYPGGQLFNGSLIHTGTGGGGHDIMRQNTECQVFGYGIEIFAADWEVLYYTYQKTRFVNSLKGENQWQKKRWEA